MFYNRHISIMPAKVFAQHYMWRPRLNNDIDIAECETVV